MRRWGGGGGECWRVCGRGEVQQHAWLWLPPLRAPTHHPLTGHLPTDVVVSQLGHARQGRPVLGLEGGGGWVAGVGRAALAVALPNHPPSHATHLAAAAARAERCLAPLQVCLPAAHTHQGHAGRHGVGAHARAAAPPSHPPTRARAPARQLALPLLQLPLPPPHPNAGHRAAAVAAPRAATATPAARRGGRRDGGLLVDRGGEELGVGVGGASSSTYTRAPPSPHSHTLLRWRTLPGHLSLPRAPPLLPLSGGGSASR